ncbi:DUF1661 domain-containing protein [Porphyromonas gingivalis]|nr:DUF1661 domain-containing protein [Porphyromonas gingivalis]
MPPNCQLFSVHVKAKNLRTKTKKIRRVFSQKIAPQSHHFWFVISL